MSSSDRLTSPPNHSHISRSSNSLIDKNQLLTPKGSEQRLRGSANSLKGTSTHTLNEVLDDGSLKVVPNQNRRLSNAAFESAQRAKEIHENNWINNMSTTPLDASSDGLQLKVSKVEPGVDLKKQVSTRKGSASRKPSTSNTTNHEDSVRRESSLPKPMQPELSLSDCSGVVHKLDINQVSTRKASASRRPSTANATNREDSVHEECTSPNQMQPELSLSDCSGVVRKLSSAAYETAVQQKLTKEANWINATAAPGRASVFEPPTPEAALEIQLQGIKVDPANSPGTRSRSRTIGTEPGTEAGARPRTASKSISGNRPSVTAHSNGNITVNVKKDTSITVNQK
ncbi:hypothetical protein BC833DRAFT_587162 [Globomyces pollinis-pini]|nr:hypothetical protein BC833DRAFT_587162 [Globomyces pollinis-pini]